MKRLQTVNMENLADRRILRRLDEVALSREDLSG